MTREEMFSYLNGCADGIREAEKDTVPLSVIEDIIAEIMQYMFLNGFGSEYQDDMRKIIEKHISGKEN